MGFKSIMQTDKSASMYIYRPKLDVLASISYEALNF